MSEGSLASEKDPFLELLPHQHSKTMKKNTKQVGISDMLKEIVNKGNKCIVLNIFESGSQHVDTIHTQNVYATKEQDTSIHRYTDRQVAKALTNIVGKGKPIDSKQKWAGALWMLHWMCGYPIKAQEFCARIDQLPLPDDLEYQCDYRNIRELATLSFIAQDATQMEKVIHSKNDENTFLQLRYVALALSQELKKICGQSD